MRNTFWRSTAALLLCLALSVAAAPALASMQRVEQDRSDNFFSFTYRALSGRMPSATSSVVFTRRKVDFFAYVRERRDAAEGERLAGRLVLALASRGTGPIRYKGEFTFRISDSEGTVLTLTRDAQVILRDRPGDRRARITFHFDLPSGRYEASGTFRSA